FERACMMVILLNCVTLGMYRPCADEVCDSNRCKILQHFDDVIFAFFAVEMLIKITAMGAFGKNAYLAETWNRLDFFIVIAGSLEYCLDVGNINLSAIRTVRVLRPLRAINRIPSMRILVMLLLDTLPMLGNVLLLCFFVFFIFGIVGVQLWAGLLRQRCYIELPPNVSLPGYLSPYYYERVKVLNPVSTYYQSLEAEKDYICSLDKDNGVHRCSELPQARYGGKQCNGTALPFADNVPMNGSCVNWNQYYTYCRAGDRNPFQGAISFDNIGLAWVAIFLVISLEGWTDIMYYVQDAHSFWDFTYFVLLIVVGSFFMINLCLVVIATQFSETKKREMERMRIERARFNSSSTLASTNASEPTGCYSQLFKYIAHLGRRARRKFLRFCRKHKRKRTPTEEGHPSSISLRRRCYNKPKWQPGQSSMKNHFSKSEGSTTREFSSLEVKSDSPVAPFASPEISDIDLVASPRESFLCEGGLEHHQVAAIPVKAAGIKTEILPHHRQSTSGSSRRTSQYTCAELLAIGATQGAVLAGFSNNFAMQNFYSRVYRGAKHSSAPQLMFYHENETEDSRLNTEWSDSESDLDYGLGMGKNGQSRFCRWWKEQQAKVKSFTDHTYFQRGILTAILVNTLSMGIEYHNQPEELTLAVEISNVIFTAVFFLEMILKMFAEGFCSYISSGFNVFDSVIVVLSLVELCQSSGSGLSVLRTFRLLRILKLVRFMPALRRQLIIMLRTVDNVAVFFALLILFIFIFSILGMNLFGCKFCKKMPDGITQCDRKNFDSLLWAIVTVFQILTQEDWNVVLFNGMEKTSHWAALYFVALMTFGNYVLFNLLVAILVEGFSAEDDKKDSENRSSCSICEKQECETSTDKENLENVKWIPTEDDPKDNIEKEIKMKAYPYVLTVIKHQDRLNGNGGGTDNLNFPPVITHTAATPQGSPNATLTLQRDINNRLCPEKALNISNPSIITIDKSSRPQSISPDILHLNGMPVFQVASLNIPSIHLSGSPQNSRRSSVIVALSRQSSIVSNGSRKNSLGPRLNLQRKGSKSSTSSGNKGSFNGWKSHKRKKSENESSENGSGPEDVVLNNMTTSHSPSHQSTEHQHYNGSIPTLQNTPNNKRPLPLQNSHNSSRVISPQNSIKSVSLSQYRDNNGTPSTPVANEHAPCSRQMSLNSSIQSQNTLSPSNTCYLPSRQTSISGSSMKEEFKPNNLEGAQIKVENRRSSVDCELPDKPLNRFGVIQHRSPRFVTYCPHRKASEVTALVQDIRSDSEDCQIMKHCYEKLCWFIEPKGWIKEREDYALFLFARNHFLRRICNSLAENKWFDYTILVFIASNCITLAMERPTIPPESWERVFLTSANYIFTIVFAFEMAVKVLAKGLWYGPNAYFKSGWNIMDGFVVGISLVDVLLSVVAESSPRIFGILRVFRLLRSLRPLRVINRAPGLKLVVQTLLSSLRPIGNIVLICCTFFIIFGILGVQLFKGSMYYCEGPTASRVRNKSECLQDPRNVWQNRKYNFDNLGQALMSLFVLSSKDGWVNIMYTGLDAVGVDQQPIENYNEWRLLYFISFLLLVAFFVLNMFVGVVVENFHRCRKEQELEEKARRAAKRAKKMDKKRRKMRRPPYYINYSRPRLFTHNIITSKYFDLAIAAVIGLNVVTMAMEFYMMPKKLEYALKVFNYFFTAVFIVEAIMKIVALGILKYLKNRWNQLDIVIVGLSIAGIVLEKMESDLIPINPTIIRVFRVLRIARVLKLLKMAKGIRALLDTVMQALPQVGNLGLLFFLLFFIFAALGVELFGRLECTEDLPCEGLGEHAHFKDFGMAFLTLFRVATGDNWNGIMKDTLRDNCDYSSDCIKNCCISPIIAPLYFVIFVLMAQFVLVNVVVAVLMKHLEESHKQMDDDMEMDAELERELAAEVQLKKLAEMGDQVIDVSAKGIGPRSPHHKKKIHKPLVKMASLPPNFVFPFNSGNDSGFRRASLNLQSSRNTTDCVFSTSADIPTISTNFPFSPPQFINAAVTTPNVNIRQASPDESESKVTVANLSPVPLRSSFGSTLNVPNGSFGSPKSPVPSIKNELESSENKLIDEPILDSPCPQNQPLDDWACVFASMNTDQYKVHFLPVLRNDVIGSANLCDKKLLDSLGVNRNRSVSNAFLATKNNQSDDCDSGCASIDKNISSDQNTGDNSIRTAHLYESNSGEASLSSPSILDAERFHDHHAPLIIRRLRKKLVSLGGESSLSSQSDVPDETKDKSFAPDSTSLEC
ncbi:voltage-dependent T-type calcium channel subunit alpha-1H-like, partial [Uloborus diversus]|uniref:voltage-dependent T-type calcium channel subunit alpha-1H-like n=1 Tax=Uloborus diversus TaxID=327109 RepID=UPI00240A904E